MELTACERLHNCVVESQIAQVRVADCSCSLVFENTKNIEHLTMVGLAPTRESDEEDLYDTAETMILKIVCDEDPGLRNSLAEIETG
jgi:exosome complex RNA-binding protein Rrp42 (RNase PH superfamily)